MSCVSCHSFNGSPEKENMCSSCFKTAHPEKAEEEARLQKEKENVQKEFKAALSAKDKATATEIFNKSKDPYLQVYTNNEFAEATRKDLDTLNFYLSLACNDNGGIKAIFKYRVCTPGTLANFDRLVSMASVRAAVTNEMLIETFYMGDKQEKLEFVNRLIAPEFTENDQVQVTKKVVDAAKYAIKPPNNAATKLGKEVVKLIEDAFAARNKRLADNRKPSESEAVEGEAEDKETEEVDKAGKKTARGRKSNADKKEVQEEQKTEQRPTRGKRKTSEDKKEPEEKEKRPRATRATRK